MHFYRFAYKIVLKMTTEMRKRRDMGNPLQAVNSKYGTVDTATSLSRKVFALPYYFATL